VITIEDITQPEKKPIRNVITVDVSGSVLKPSIYTVPIGTRIHDVLKLAGGLDTQADAAYIARNFNFSLVLLDHHKLHFPSLKEIHQGTFVEQPRSLTYLEVENKGNNKSTPPVSNSSLISINTAEKSQLDSLPGIGEKTAQKIIENRPYDNLTILTEKKIVTAKVFEGLKDLIQL
jgi:competence protein ComEA